MTPLGRPTYLRPCTASDDAFLYDVFCTTWADEVAALPNQNLAQHVLRIQHIAEERRYASRHPGHERYVVEHDGEPAGRLYLDRDDSSIHLVDLTLLPAFQGRGTGSRILRDLCEQARREQRVLRLRVSRRNRGAVELCHRLGFTLCSVDDLEHHFEWVAPAQPDGAAAQSAARSAAGLRPGASR